VRAFVESDVALATFIRGSLFSDSIWHVVEEVRGEIELDAVATTLGRSNPRLEPSSMVPPVARRFAGKRDHCVYEDEHADRRPRSSAASAAMKAPIDWATSVTSFRFPIEAITRSA